MISFFSLAEEALHDSKVAIDNGSFQMSVNRSYYAAFYAATAMLLKKDLYHKTHSGTIHQLIGICSKW